MPEMEDASIEVTDPIVHRVEERFGPCEVMFEPPGVHPQCLRDVIELSEGRAQNRSISTSQDAPIVKAMPLEYIPAARPGESGRRTSQQWSRSRGTISILGTESIRQLMRGQIMPHMKEAQQRELIERPNRAIGPVTPFEHDVAVQPGDMVTAARD